MPTDILNRSSSLPDSPTSHSLPGTWRSSCFCLWSRSCCNCRPAHHTWNLEGRAGRLGRDDHHLTPPCSRTITHIQVHNLHGGGSLRSWGQGGEWLAMPISLHTLHSQCPAKSHQTATGQLLDPLELIDTYRSGACLESLGEQQLPHRESPAHDPQR